MLPRVSGNGKSLRERMVDLCLSLGACVRNVFALPKADSETAPTTDPHLGEWLRNDVKVVVDPSHRYGGDPSGLLADSDLENAHPTRAED